MTPMNMRGNSRILLIHTNVYVCVYSFAMCDYIKCVHVERFQRALDE